MEVQGLAFDTMLGESLLNPDGHNLALKNLAWARLGVEMTPLSDLIGTGKAQIAMSAVAVERVTPYAAADADMTLRLVQPLERELKAKALWRLFTDVEMPLIRVLMGMERTGIALDTAYLAELSVDMKARLGDLERQIQEIVGHAFNIASTEQLSDALFITLGLPKIGAHKTKSGRYSTAADVLETLRGQHLVIDLILEHRQLAKLKSTYIDALPLVVSPRDGRLHTSFNQTGAVTGRLSSSEPNLQNIPIRTDLGRQVRRAFIAHPGCVLLAADYSQVELRILAHVSNDPAMLDAFQRGEDIHRSTAAAIFGVPLDQVTSDMRRVAKTTNFAISYGVTGFGLARQTGLTTEEAQLFIDSYFHQYPGVRDYVDGTKARAGRDGYVETLLGRRRYFPELQSAAQGHKIAHNVRLAAERMAVNAPIQGSAADIIKIAMIRLDERLRAAGLGGRMVLQVHDELILDVPESEVDRVAPIVCETMEGAFPLKASLKVDLSVGPNWLDMKGIE
jgi:DNA polymerase I